MSLAPALAVISRPYQARPQARSSRTSPGFSRNPAAISSIATAGTMPACASGGRPRFLFMISATCGVSDLSAYQPSKYSADRGFGVVMAPLDQTRREPA